MKATSVIMATLVAGVAQGLDAVSIMGSFLTSFLPPATLRPRTALQSKSVMYNHKVTVETVDGKTHTINVPEYKSVLEAFLDEGIELPHDCKLGTCLACAARLVSGEVDTTGSTLDDSVAEQGFTLTCCTYPRSDCTIKSIPEDELIDEQFARA